MTKLMMEIVTLHVDYDDDYYVGVDDGGDNNYNNNAYHNGVDIQMTIIYHVFLLSVFNVFHGFVFRVQGQQKLKNSSTWT